MMTALALSGLVVLLLYPAFSLCTDSAAHQSKNVLRHGAFEGRALEAATPTAGMPIALEEAMCVEQEIENPTGAKFKVKDCHRIYAIGTQFLSELPSMENLGSSPKFIIQCEDTKAEKGQAERL
ncbi:unnamed protein product [Vitrella brassicaformis CCMP3155]|uniref:Uncharacterized protein n=1 Tax=Vitrella brassicaformis (strain CCMP3155) TaxID=1169540 RepID=A0A0G4F7D2_VITBC|nr:unnamed protein product [Vitrella brassicaformis CCMP3155]|eukprot:CEM08572.1 unnamed protein product [Vitrella brassicaformis CCMP3155]